MKLYVAGPMTGYPDYNYPSFGWAVGRLREHGYETLNPCDNDKILRMTLSDPSWQDYMRSSIMQVLAADGVAVLDDWGLSRGARLEVDIAHGLQIPVMPVHGWIHKATDGVIKAARRLSKP